MHTPSFMKPDRFLDIFLSYCISPFPVFGNEHGTFLLTSPFASLICFTCAGRPSLMLESPTEFSLDRLCLTTGFTCARIVALFSHCASLSSLSPAASLIAGRSLGMLAEPALEERECDPRCRRVDNRFSLTFDVVDFADAFDELRKREKRFFSWDVFG